MKDISEKTLENITSLGRDTRIAFTGASGTGKTTLRDYISGKYGLQANPVGAMHVANMLGYATPYEVDQQGDRSRFQAKLQETKTRWESRHASFVADRTTLDELVYSSLHNIGGVTPEYASLAKTHMQRYTHVFYLPMNMFISIGGDPKRKHDKTYHALFDSFLRGFLEEESGSGAAMEGKIYRVLSSKLEVRQRIVDSVILQG